MLFLNEERVTPLTVNATHAEIGFTVVPVVLAIFKTTVL